MAVLANSAVSAVDVKDDGQKDPGTGEAYTPPARRRGAPVGTALGPQGVNIMDLQELSTRTAKDEGLIIPCRRHCVCGSPYTFITKTPPGRAAARRQHRYARRSRTRARWARSRRQVEEIAKLKMST